MGGDIVLSFNTNRFGVGVLPPLVVWRRVFYFYPPKNFFFFSQKINGLSCFPPRVFHFCGVLPTPMGSIIGPGGGGGGGGGGSGGGGDGRGNKI